MGLEAGNQIRQLFPTLNFSSNKIFQHHERMSLTNLPNRGRLIVQQGTKNLIERYEFLWPKLSTGKMISLNTWLENSRTAKKGEKTFKHRVKVCNRGWWPSD